jgi:membrane-bound ClpP family serine protease
MASQNGHNPDVGEAFMNKDKEVKIGDRVVHAKGSLLTLNAKEASEMVNGKPVLAEGIAQSIDDLAKKAKLGGQLVRLQPTGFEQFAFWITALAPLLLLVGIVCAYLEFKIPGATLPGIIAGICFVLFFSALSLAWPDGKQSCLVLALLSFSLKSCSLPIQPSFSASSALSSFWHHCSGRWSIAIRISPSSPRPRCCSSRC